jgi:hypothetical protein
MKLTGYVQNKNKHSAKRKFYKKLDSRELLSSIIVKGLSMNSLMICRNFLIIKTMRMRRGQIQVVMRNRLLMLLMGLVGNKGNQVNLVKQVRIMKGHRGSLIHMFCRKLRG